MKITHLLAAAAALSATTALADGHLSDFEGREIVVVTENAYPPLQFIDASGTAVGWEYDAMAEIAERLNATVVYENISWDAMIPAVSEGQFDMGMTGITIREDRAEIVDFSDSYMTSEMVMLVRGDEERFSDAASFAADPDLLVAAQPGTTPFYVAVYDVLDADEANPRIQLFETFGAGIAQWRRGPCVDRRHRWQWLCRSKRGRFENRGRKAGHRGFRVHLSERVRSGRADQCRDCRYAGRWHH